MGLRPKAIKITHHDNDQPKNLSDAAKYDAKLFLEKRPKGKIQLPKLANKTTAAANDGECQLKNEPDGDSLKRQPEKQTHFPSIPPKTKGIQQS